MAIKVMGGPTITTRYGRVDALSASESASSASGRLPEADKDEHHLRSLAMGFQCCFPWPWGVAAEKSSISGWDFFTQKHPTFVGYPHDYGNQPMNVGPMSQKVEIVFFFQITKTAISVGDDESPMGDVKHWNVYLWDSDGNPWDELLPDVS